MTETQAANLPAARTDHALLLGESVRDVKAQTAAIHKVFKEVLKVDTHYGVIPGTPKPSLYKPGAEKIALLLHLAPSFKREMQWEGQHLTVISECTLRHQQSNTVISSAGALCTSRESKYAFRQAVRKCPKCGQPTIIKGKKEYGGGFICFAKKGGCGAKYEDKDPTIIAQSEEREENPNLADVYNTVIKMADKRAFVAATLFGTAASDIFTQDVEDFQDIIDITPAPQSRSQQPTPAHYESDEFEGLLQEMKGAFERGEGAAWWKANAGVVREHCSKEQWARYEAVKDLLKQARAGGNDPAASRPGDPQVRPQTGRDAPPASLSDGESPAGESAPDAGKPPAEARQTGPGPDASPVEPPRSLPGKQGATTDSFKHVWRELHKAHGEGYGAEFMDEGKEMIGKLHAVEKKALVDEHARLVKVAEAQGTML